MNGHISPEDLAEFAWGALDAAEQERVEAHVAGCPGCALQAERCRIEARKMSEALATAVPAGLAARVLDAATPASAAPVRRSWFPFGAAAAAAVLAVATGVAVHERGEAVKRAEKAEKQLALVAPPAKIVAETDVDTVINGLCRAEIESNISEILVSGTMSGAANGPLRLALLEANQATTEMVARLSKGEVDIEQLRTTDMLAGLDGELRAALPDDADYRTVVAQLSRRSRDTAESASRRLLRGLQHRAGLDEAQATQIEAMLVKGTSWRRDLPFLPEVARDALVACQLGRGTALKPEVAALLTKEQQIKVSEALSQAEAAREKYWAQLRQTQ